ncbi:MAG: PilZ domain-containing protein [Deltaproteobacteria bacterium]
MSPEAKRRRLRLPVEVTLPDGTALDGTLHDLSRSGAFVELEEALDPGTALELCIRGHTSIAGLSLRARVVRRGRFPKELASPTVEHLLVRVPGVGVHFGPLAAEASEQLSSYLAQMEDDT